MLVFGFERLGLHRIWAQCVADNTASAHVLEKLGLRREGHFREHVYFKGRWWDSLVYAIVDCEWREHAEVTHRTNPTESPDRC
jgi:RimJ/RimL family protein N-acetyltransferase